MDVYKDICISHAPSKDGELTTLEETALFRRASSNISLLPGKILLGENVCVPQNRTVVHFIHNNHCRRTEKMKDMAAS